MTDRPIIFSAPMIRALLAGRKTQTRRIIRDAVPDAPAMDAIAPNGVARHPAPYLDAYCGKPITADNPRGMSDRWCWWTRDDRPGPTFKVPYVPGDRLYVRERAHIDGLDVNYAADMPVGLDLAGLGYRPSIHMPRRASRLTLMVTAVRVGRLNDISEADAWAEGCKQGEADDVGGFFPAEEADPSGIGHRGWDCARDWFADLWDDINGEEA